MGFRDGHPDFPANPQYGDKHNIWLFEYEFDGNEWVCSKGMNIQGATAFEAYVSPTTGKVIASEHQRKNDLKESGCVDARDVQDLPLKTASGKVVERNKEQGA